LETAWEEGLLPIITGGTGLYFKALEQGLADIPSITPDIREKWRSFRGNIHAELMRRDPQGASTLQPNDRQRITRALEVFEGTGKSLSEWLSAAGQGGVLTGAAVERCFLDVPRAELYARAETRFDQMIAAGAVEEVRALQDFDPALPMMKAIGVPELSAHLRGEIGLDEAVTKSKTATRQYIKRQLTWWRGQMKNW
jgi:tRNA dimethylallyltransferase